MKFGSLGKRLRKWTDRYATKIYPNVVHSIAYDRRKQ